MDRIEVLDMMGELKLYGMKAAYDVSMRRRPQSGGCLERNGFTPVPGQ